ncbi:hypothetical protein EDD18DRAFT_1084510, partial [Armillaria luteobubalina]
MWNLNIEQQIHRHFARQKTEEKKALTCWERIHYLRPILGCVSLEESQHYSEVRTEIGIAVVVGAQQTNLAPGQGPIPNDYTIRYPKDPIGEEMSANGRFWRTYSDEALIIDREMIDVYHDTINVLLVFAGLFSAVLTAFVIETSQNLQPDYTEVSASLLMELVGHQRAANLSSDPSSPFYPSISFSPSSVDVWLNSLWFVSLTLSLITALVAVLVKQWLHQYISVISDILPRDRGSIRQYRYIGLTTWQVPMIIGFLPVLLHISLGLFFAGLSIYLFAL